MWGQVRYTSRSLKGSWKAYEIFQVESDWKLNVNFQKHSAGEQSLYMSLGIRTCSSIDYIYYVAPGNCK